MVPPQQRDPARPECLQTKQQHERLHGVVAAVDVVAQEDVARVRDRAARIEESQKVVELAVQVTADVDGGGDGLHGALLAEEGFDGRAEVEELSFGDYVAAL